MEDTCFICPNTKVTTEFTGVFLEMRGIPNTAEEKENILKVICQLLRVKWATVESLLSVDDSLPFCSSCLNQVIHLICLREQLCQIESDIRDQIQMMEGSVAQVMDSCGGSPDDYNCGDLEDGKFELPESYEAYRKSFQEQVMREHLNKTLLQAKIEEHNQNEMKFAIQFLPSLVQLKLEKNVFQIIDQANENGKFLDISIVPGSVTDDIKDNCLELNEPEAKLELVDHGTETNYSLINTTTIAEPRPRASCARQLDFANIIIDSRNKEEEEVSDDSDYGSPSKKLKLKLQKRKRGLNKMQNANQKGSSSLSAVLGVVPLEPSDESEGSASSDEESGGELSIDSDPDGSSDGSSTSSGGGEEIDGNDRKTKISVQSNKQKTSPAPTKILKRMSRRQRCSAKKNSLASIRLTQPEGTFSSKNGTLWTSQEPQNILPFDVTKEEGGLRGAAKAKLTPVETFKLFFPPSLIDLIVKYTNEFADYHISDMKLKGKEAAYRDWRPISSDEIYAYVGILLYLGTEKKRQTGMAEIWTQNEKYIIPAVIATMSKNRFQQIQKYLRFDDRVARAAKQAANGIEPRKLNYIAEVFDPFVETFATYFCPFDNLVVDEMLVKYRGSVKFRVYMKSKPGKYGMKIWALCDATTGYILRISMYEGKVGDKVETQLGKKVVLSLVEKYFKSGRTVTTDNFFTSKSLGDELLRQNMYLLGTLNKNRMDIIPQFADGKGRELESSIFAFHEDYTMVSYVPRKNRTVVLLSTCHHIAQINPEIKNKPQMILDYNKTKGGVDTADFLIAQTSCQRTTSRWTMKLFQAMLDIGAVNAFIIWKISNSDPAFIKDREYRGHKGSRKQFLKAVSEGLMEPVIRARAENAYRHPLHIQNAIEIMGFEVSNPNRVQGQYDKVQQADVGRQCKKLGSCRICAETTEIRRMGISQCGGCQRWICGEHAQKYIHCYDCVVGPTKIYKESGFRNVVEPKGVGQSKAKAGTSKKKSPPQKVSPPKRERKKQVLRITKKQMLEAKKKREPKKKRVVQEPILFFGI